MFFCCCGDTNEKQLVVDETGKISFKNKAEAKKGAMPVPIVSIFSNLHHLNHFLMFDINPF